jgi:phosphoesterase, MJ0936 family
MKIIVFSDSHGNINNMKKVIDKTLPTTDLYIHCGDGLFEFNMLSEKYPECGFIGVKGNGDMFASAELYDMIIDIDGYRTLITHGHRYYGDLLDIAKSRDVQIVLYGHSHAREYAYRDGIYLFNPGSISLPRDGKLPSYGVIETRKGILFSHGEINNN